MQNKRGIVVIGIFIGSILFYSFYLKERLAFNKAKESKTLPSLQSYFLDYPNGRYVKEVEIIEEQIAFKNVRKSPTMFNIHQYYKFCEKGSRMENVRFEEVKQTFNVAVVRSFISDYPTSKNLAQSKQKLNDLWASELIVYETSVKNADQNADKKSIVFFRELLNYMRSKDLSTIYIDFESKIELKDFYEYSKKAKDLASLDCANSSDKKYLLESNLIPLKRKFSQGNLDVLEDEVVQEMKSVLFGIFSNDFFEIEMVNENTKLGTNDLVIVISYNIENQEINDQGTKYPSIWRYSEASIFKSWFMGIDANFNFDFNIRNINKSYQFKYKGSPGDNLKGFDDIGDAYRMMVKNTFSDFIKNISSNFGLKLPLKMDLE
jgi:hypothetical protein